jgi:hypothetical protein
MYATKDILCPPNSNVDAMFQETVPIYSTYLSNNERHVLIPSGAIFVVAIGGWSSVLLWSDGLLWSDCRALDNGFDLIGRDGGGGVEFCTRQVRFLSFFSPWERVH